MLASVSEVLLHPCISMTANIWLFLMEISLEPQRWGPPTNPTAPRPAAFSAGQFLSPHCQRIVGSSGSWAHAGSYLGQRLASFCFLLTVPGTCWVHVFIAQLQAILIQKWRASPYHSLCTDGWQLASPSEEAIMHKCLKYVLVLEMTFY